jgi:hypothetical protein
MGQVCELIPNKRCDALQVEFRGPAALLCGEPNRRDAGGAAVDEFAVPNVILRDRSHESPLAASMPANSPQHRRNVEKLVPNVYPGCHAVFVADKHGAMAFRSMAFPHLQVSPRRAARSATLR